MRYIYYIVCQTINSNNIPVLSSFELGMPKEITCLDDIKIIQDKFDSSCMVTNYILLRKE